MLLIQVKNQSEVSLAGSGIPIPFIIYIYLYYSWLIQGLGKAKHWIGDAQGLFEFGLWSQNTWGWCQGKGPDLSELLQR